MTKLEVFDPAMCCDTGVCGPEVDPILPRFAGDLEWIKANGVTVRRFNLAQEPGAFVANTAVKQIVDETGGDGLPVIILNGAVVSQGSYPTRAALARLAGIDEESGLAPGPLDTPAVGELITIGQPSPPTAKLAVIHVANKVSSEEGPADNGCAPNSGCCG